MVKEAEEIDDVQEGHDDDEENDTEKPLSKKRKKKRGMNKNRPRYTRPDPSKKLCLRILQGSECTFKESCNFSHDIASYMAVKPADIGDKCLIFEKYGKCRYGVTCRYGKSHISEDFENIVNEELCKQEAPCTTKNIISKDLQHALRKKTYDFSAADVYMTELKKLISEGRQFSELANLPKTCKTSGVLTDEDVIRIRPEEKKVVSNAAREQPVPLQVIIAQTLHKNGSL